MGGMNAEWSLREDPLVVTNFQENFLPLSPSHAGDKHFLIVFFCVVDYFLLTVGLGFGITALHGVLVC